jgi:hypothetical protein
MGRAVLVLLSVVLLAAAWASPGSAMPPVGHAPAWSSTERVLAGDYSEIAMVVADSGVLHVALIDRTGLWYLSNATSAWRSRLVLRHPAGKDYHSPSIALDEASRVTIAVGRSVCNDCAPSDEDGVFMVTDRGRARGTFPSRPTRVAPYGMTDPSIKTVGGRIYLAYVDCACYPDEYPAPVFVGVRSPSGTWTRRKVAPFGWGTSLRVGSDGGARVAFEKGDGIGFAASRSPNGPYSLTYLQGYASGDHEPSLALDDRDEPHIAWLSWHDDDDDTSLFVSGPSWPEGRWVASGSFGSISLSLDQSSAPYVLVGGSPGLWAYHLDGGGWRVVNLDDDVRVSDVALRASSSGTVAMWIGRSRTDRNGVYLARH